jgi:hypothetical protein
MKAEQDESSCSAFYVQERPRAAYSFFGST